MQTGWLLCCGGLEMGAETAKVSLNQCPLFVPPHSDLSQTGVCEAWYETSHLNYNLLNLCQYIWRIVFNVLSSEATFWPLLHVRGSFCKHTFSMCFYFFLPGWRCSETAHQCWCLCCLHEPVMADAWRCVWHFYVDGNLQGFFFSNSSAWKGFCLKWILAADTTLHFFFYFWCNQQSYK